MAWSKPKITKKETTQKFNLKEIFGKDFSGHEDLKLQIGQAIIDKIVKRTESGVDISDKPFKPYSKAYRDSDEYKDFKGSARKVNMTLTGSMLESIDIIRSSGNTLSIGIKDDTEVLKSYNHNTGDTVPKRKFFGIRKEDIAEIKKEFSSELKELKKTKTTTGSNDLAELIATARSLEGFFDDES